MDKIGIQTKVSDAINAIVLNNVHPIVDDGEYLYHVGIESRSVGDIELTKFDKKSKIALETIVARFGTYHTIQHVLRNPLPKYSTKPKVLELPDVISSQPLPDPTIILGFY